MNEAVQAFFDDENNISRFNQMYHQQWEQIREACKEKQKSNKYLAWTKRKVNNGNSWYKYAECGQSAA